VPITATIKPFPETSTTPAPLPASPTIPAFAESTNAEQQAQAMPHGIASEEQPSKSEDQAATQQNNGGFSIVNVSQTVVLAETNTHFFAYILLLPSFH